MSLVDVVTQTSPAGDGGVQRQLEAGDQDARRPTTRPIRQRKTAGNTPVRSMTSLVIH